MGKRSKKHTIKLIFKGSNYTHIYCDIELMNFYFKIIFWLILLSSNLSAQYHEIGAFLGGSNYIGDIGSTRYIYPNNSAFGLLYKWNLTTRYSLRAGVNLSKIKGSDYDTGDLNRFKRGYKFNNSRRLHKFVSEINARFESRIDHSAIFSLRNLFTAHGIALPLLSFITWPTS